MAPVCRHCGASLGIDDNECPFCRSVTELGLHRREEEERLRQALEYQRGQVEQAEAQRLRQAIEKNVEKTAKSALLWSVASLLFCCVPVPAIVGIVLGLRARTLGKERGIVAPPNATVSVVLSCVSLCMFVGFVVFTVTGRQQKEHRKSELRAIAATQAPSAGLSASVACAMAELYAFENGWPGSSNRNIEPLRCSSFEERGNEARIEVELQISSWPKQSITACFRRTTEWRVTELTKAGTCHSAAATPPRTDGAEAPKAVTKPAPRK